MFILDYALNAKFELEYYKETVPVSISNKYDFDSLDAKLNPEIEITIKITPEYLDIKTFNEKFFIFDYKTFTSVSKPIKIKNKISNLNFLVLRKCDNDDCSDVQRDLENLLNFEIVYPGFHLNHEDFNNPIVKKDLSVKGFFYFSRSTLYWKNIKYQEKNMGISRLFKRTKEYITGFVEKTEMEVLCMVLGGYKPVGQISFNLDFGDNLEIYKRSQIGLMDLISKIGVLFTTFYPIFSFIFQFYSTNFGNYKIIQDIIIEKIETKNIFKIKLNDLENNEKIDLNNEEFNINDEIIDDDDNNINLTPKWKKLSFYDFFLNNIYSECCCKSNNQRLISLSNKIIMKYLSMDNILYNMLILENLLKDYKWNNPSLNDIGNNNLIIQIQNFQNNLALLNLE